MLDFVTEQKDKIVNVAIYARVSTTEQAEKGTSIKSQIEFLREHCKIHDYQIFNEYIDDGYSGATADRPALQKLLSDAEEGKFSIVLVYKTDRLSRSIPLTVKLVLETFQAQGIVFKSISEPYDTSTPAGRMFFVQLAGFADFERETIRERTKEGKLRNVKDGKWMGSNAHYAFDINRKTKKLVLNEKRAKIVRMIVDWVLDGDSCWTISRRLNKLGVPTWKEEHGWKIKKAYNQWHPNVVRVIVSNPIITGNATYGGIKLSVPQVITEEEFAEVRRQLTVNKVNAKRNGKNFYLLRGILECKRCGSKLYGMKRRDRRRKNYWEKAYFCPSGNYPRADKSCGLRRLHLEKTENLIWNLAKDLVTNSKKLKNAIQSKHIDLFVNEVITNDQVSQYDARISQLKVELKRLLSLYSQSEIYTVEELDEKAAEIRSKINDEEKARDQFRRTRERILEQRHQIDNAEGYFKSISKRLDNFSDEERRELVQLLFDKIYVDWDEKSQLHLLQVEGSIPIFEKPELKREEVNEVSEESCHHVITEPWILP